MIVYSTLLKMTDLTRNIRHYLARHIEISVKQQETLLSSGKIPGFLFNILVFYQYHQMFEDLMARNDNLDTRISSTLII